MCSFSSSGVGFGAMVYGTETSGNGGSAGSISQIAGKPASGQTEKSGNLGAISAMHLIADLALAQVIKFELEKPKWIEVGFVACLTN